MKNKKGKKATCHNKRCIKKNKGKPYTWFYTGDNPFYACCPRCKSSVKLQEE